MIQKKEHNSLEKRCDCSIYIKYGVGYEAISITIDNKNYLIKIEDKYKQDMLNLLEHY